MSITYKNLAKDIDIGTRILADDGLIEMKVTEIDSTPEGDDIKCLVIHGGIISNNKSCNFPGAKLSMPYVSERDKSDIIFAAQTGFDFIAASFVSCDADILEENGGKDIKIIAKIENQEGVDNIDDILRVSDGIMVARGDMGVEVDFEKLPGIQKRFIKKCYQSGKIVITATQMLESMISSTTPTRAEISDVANAVFDGTSAVMLSGETAMGIDPPHVVEVMSKIARQAEQDAFDMYAYSDIKYEVDDDDTTNAICDAACTTARDLRAKAIIAVTQSGYTARLVSKFRPLQTIVAATPEQKTYHQLSMSWGVHAVIALDQQDTDSLFRHAIDCAKQIDAVAKGDTAVITGGVPLNVNGTTNTLKVVMI